MGERIQALIRETEGWREKHRAAGRMIEAAACAIRLKAFRDVLDCFAPSRGGENGG